MGAQHEGGEDGDIDGSLMSRLTSMKLNFRDLTTHSAQQVCLSHLPTTRTLIPPLWNLPCLMRERVLGSQMISNIKEEVYRDPSFSPLDWEVVISSVSNNVDVLTSTLLDLVDKACLSVQCVSPLAPHAIPHTDGLPQNPPQLHSLSHTERGGAVQGRGDQGA
jgi:hypothetical protein